MKNFTITVIHAAFLEDGETPTAVAKVFTEDMDLFEATEYAYRYSTKASSTAYEAQA
jgi:hypothetical protein